MANPTTNYSFAMPTNTDLVKDLPADFEVFGQAVDTQMKTNADLVIPKTIVDAKGDLIAATAADTVARLAVGTNDQVLMADSTAATGLKWGTVAAGGITLLSTTNLTTGSTTVSSISGSYKNLIVRIQGAYSSGGANLNFRFNGDTGANYTRNYFKGSGGTVTSSIATGANLLQVNYMASGSTYDQLSVLEMNIPNYSAAFSKYAFFSHSSNDGVNQYANGALKWNNTAAITSVTALLDSGTFSAGQILIYGVS